MHPYPELMVDRPESRTVSVGTEPLADDEPGAVVRLVRDGAVPRASCPHCGGRLLLSTVGSRWQVHGPKDVADQLILQLGTLEREELHILILNTRNVVIDQVRLYQGNVSSSLVRIGELFRRAVELHASAILISHNHPSGDPTPSPDDLRLTAEALAAGRLLDIALLDHIIVGGGSFMSMRDRGTAFDSPGEHRAGEARARSCHVARSRRPTSATADGLRSAPTRFVAYSANAWPAGLAGLSRHSDGWMNVGRTLGRRARSGAGVALAHSPRRMTDNVR